MSSPRFVSQVLLVNITVQRVNAPFTGMRGEVAILSLQYGFASTVSNDHELTRDYPLLAVTCPTSEGQSPTLSRPQFEYAHSLHDLHAASS